MMIEYISKEQDWVMETTTYWFDVWGTIYGVVESCGESCVIDSDGQPVNLADSKNYHIRDIEKCVTEDMRIYD